MTTPSPNPLQHPHELNRSSPEFPSQLTGILLGEDFVNCSPDLPCKDSGPFAEYLDSARLQITLVCPLLDIVAGPQRPLPYQLCLSPLLVRTSENLLCQQGPADIARALRRFSESGRSPDRLRNLDQYARGNPRRTASSH